MPDGAVSEVRFRRIFESHYDELLRYCLRRLPSADASDAVAEIFTVAWRKIDQLPEDDALPWLYGVGRNVVRNLKRSSTRKQRLSARLVGLASGQANDVEIVIARTEEQRQILQALERLSHEDQEILRMRAYESLSSREIGVALGCSETAARKRLSRATSRLGHAFNVPDISPPTRSRAIQKGGAS